MTRQTYETKCYLNQTSGSVVAASRRLRNNNLEMIGYIDISIELKSYCFALIPPPLEMENH